MYGLIECVSYKIMRMSSFWTQFDLCSVNVATILEVAIVEWEVTVA